MHRFAVTAALAFALAAPALAQTGPVYVFGDSFTDSGNVFTATGGAVPPEAAGYFQGRFQDGYNFADFIAKRLTGGYATAFLQGGVNFSVGGARAAGDAVFPEGVVPGLPTQLALYAASVGFVDPNGLYIINFGNNDVSAIQSGDTYGLTAAQYGALYTSNIVNAVLGLNAGGATRIIVLGVPNPGEIEGQILQAQLNAGLDAIAPFLTADLTRFDFFDFFLRLAADPVLFNLPADVDFTTPCIAARPVIDGAIDCTGFFSFDGTHVIETVQYEVARAVLADAGLPGIPEPATWALLIGGFGLVGGALRHRRSNISRTVLTR